MIETILHVLLNLIAMWTGMAIAVWLWKNRMENEESAIGKGISSGKTAPVPKTPPVRRPLTDEDIMSVQPMVPVKTNLVFEYIYVESEE